MAPPSALWRSRAGAGTAAVARVPRRRPLPSRWQQQQQRRPHFTAAQRPPPPAAAAPDAAPQQPQREADLNSSVYLSASAQPAPFVGPIAVAHIPGKGRGLVATSALAAGQLLLVVPPLAFLEGELGEIPEHDELIEVIASSGALYSPYQAGWLNTLTTTVALTDPQQDAANNNNASGSSSSGSSGSSTKQQQPVVPEFLPPPGQAAWLGAGAAGGSSSGGSSSADRVPFEALGMDEERLWAAVVLNCFGEGFPDLPASLCAGVTPLNSQLGLWGPFSLLNHACSPNAVNYTLRDCMVVRCVTPVAAGEEICINYLGRSVLTPLSQRQEELEACYGFTCDCRRCTAEAAWSGVTATPASIPLPTFLDQLHAQIGQEFEPRRADIAAGMRQQQDDDNDATAAKGGVDSSSSADVDQQQQERLQQLVADMRQQYVQLQEAARSRADSSEEEACWVLASAFDLLGLLHDATEQLGEADSAVLASIVQVCERVCPGSDLQVFQALRWTSLAQQRQQQQEQLQEEDAAMDRLLSALQLRYGPQVTADKELLAKMVAASSQAANMVWL